MDFIWFLLDGTAKLLGRLAYWSPFENLWDAAALLPGELCSDWSTIGGSNEF